MVFQCCSSHVKRTLSLFDCPWEVCVSYLSDWAQNSCLEFCLQNSCSLLCNKNTLSHLLLLEKALLFFFRSLAVAIYIASLIDGPDPELVPLKAIAFCPYRLPLREQAPLQSHWALFEESGLVSRISCRDL